MTEPDEALLWAREDWAKGLKSKGARRDVHQGLWDEYLDDAVRGYLAGAAASADRIKELEARVAELEDMVSRYLIQMSDMITRLKERHPEDFVWLKDGDEPTDEDAYGWGCQGWGERR